LNLERTAVGRIEVFDHTADVGLRVFATDLNDLFETAAEGLLDYVVANRAEVRPAVEESIELTAEGPAELLIDWLNELIFRIETQHRLYSKFAVRVVDDGKTLMATIHGEAIDRARHVLDHEVKAVTRHGVMLVPCAEGWVAELILDI
jgi:SHS2 domain-containing protein